MKLTTSLIALAAMVAVARTSPMATTEAIADSVHDAPIFKGGVRASAPPAGLMADDSKVAGLPAKKLRPSASEYAQEFRDPSHAMTQEQIATRIGNNLFATGFHQEDKSNAEFLKMTSRLIYETHGNDLTGDRLSRFLFDFASHPTPEARDALEQAKIQYLMHHPRVEQVYRIRAQQFEKRMTMQAMNYLQQEVERSRILSDVMYSYLPKETQEKVTNDVRTIYAQKNAAAERQRASYNARQAYQQQPSAQGSEKKNSAEAERIYGPARTYSTPRATEHPSTNVVNSRVNEAQAGQRSPATTNHQDEYDDEDYLYDDDAEWPDEQKAQDDFDNGRGVVHRHEPQSSKGTENKPSQPAHPLNNAHSTPATPKNDAPASTPPVKAT